MSSWILAGLGSLGSSFIENLIDKFNDRAIERALQDPGVGADLLKLKTTLTGTMHIIGRVENMWIKDEETKKRLKELVMELKDTAYEAEDLIDEIQFRVLKKQIEQQGAQGDEASNRSSSSSSSGLPPTKKIKLLGSEVISRFFGRGDDVIRVREVRVKLDKYTADIEHFIATIDADGKQMIASVVPRTTTSFPVETQVFGREEQLNHLLEQLMQSADGSSNSSISTLTIVGIGGVGKTTFAQQAYHHERVKDSFQPKVWVCVSDNFNVERLTRDIIDSLTPHKRDLNNLDALQVAVKEELSSKRFLLVLDDVWNEDSLKWERFCAPLRYGEPGSKILVTTRSRKIADMVGNPIPLNGLDDASYWELFKKCAFGSQDAGECPQLEAIAKKIAGRLKGLPLAARTVGGLLKAQMNEKHWRNIAGSEIWQLPQDEGSVLPVLQLSYQCLPAHLKRCFVFCSLFPKDYRFHEEELIRLWMAEGYVAQDNNLTMEDVGSRYFLGLVNRSFFQEGHWESVYVMHDLIHDLAQFIAEGEFCRIDDDKSKEIPNTTRHLSATLTYKTKLPEFSCCEKLRTLMINYKSNCYGFGLESSSFPSVVLFERLKNIRVLILCHCGLRELPETIGDLIHLRYLDISYNSNIRKLPESLCGLYNLQVLNLTGCKLQRLPHGISKLINLVHLNAADEIISMINDVGKLTSLQELSLFKVLKDQGHEVAQLAGLTQLHGELRITNLENVESKQEASKADLNNKQYLDELALEWTSILDGNESVVSEEEVLEGLQPHQALESLTIRGYNGVRSPSWLQAQSLANLITLELEYCKAWEDLSCIGQLPNLKNLYVKRMPAVKQISQELSTESKFLPNLEELVLEDMVALEELPWLGRLPCLKVLCIMGMSAVTKLGHGFFGCRDEGKCFPCLEELRFIDMPEWEEWSWADGRELFPCLRNLRIGRCPRLKRLPPLSPSLESLSLCQVGLTEVTGLWEEIDGSCSSMTVSEVKLYSLKNVHLMDLPECERLPCLGRLPCLKVLRIERMSALKKVGDGFFVSRDQGKCFPSLEELRFRDMPEWEEWSWADGRELFPCLRNLEIVHCPRLKRMPPLPPPLETLRLNEVGLTQVARLWEGIHGGGSCMTASLSSLEISKCPNLRNLEEGLLSHSLPNIRDIEIIECAVLVWQPVKGFKELTSLKRLSIRSCPKLLSMTRDEDMDILLPPSIQKLRLTDCGNLERLLPSCLLNLTSLTQLKIGGCSCIESLSATSLLHLKQLQSLSISKCGELRSIDGLQVLKSLRELTIKLCPKLLPNEGNEQVEEGLSVSKLCIDDAALFKASLLRRTLPSVRALTISNFPRATMSDEEEQLWRSLTALISLEFKDCASLQSLPIELHALPSLRLLRIDGCLEIQSLPEKGLPTSLWNLSCFHCHPRLMEQLEKHLAEMKSSGRFFPVNRWDIYEGIY